MEYKNWVQDPEHKYSPVLIDTEENKRQQYKKLKEQKHEVTKFRSVVPVAQL